jgi:tetratricopeptide (TPR) repeat protein
MVKDETRGLDALRTRAENAIRRGKPPSELRPLLESILHIAPSTSDDAIFAHRHLAEILIEEHPWLAALHLRSVGAVVDDDDVVHALMGLCQALLGNFQSAVAAYRRAIRIAPRNPWYHHNLGHLLDVALTRPEAAVDHLRLAHRMEPLEHEISASLAHCLARVGQLDEAYLLADEAVRAAPRNRDHRDLLRWIEGGASDERGPRRVASQPPRSGGGRRRREPAAKPLRDVERSLERGMREAGFSTQQLDRARVLWKDFLHGRTLRVHKPESYAAAIEYAIARVHRIDGVTQTSVARRYGIDRRTLKTRYFEIRDALALEPGDPRYATLGP